MLAADADATETCSTELMKVAVATGTHVIDWQWCDREKLASWTAGFLHWEATWNTFLKQRTYATKNTPRPAHASPHQKWWYTHIHTRRAHKLLATLLTTNELFTWLNTHTTQPVANTTNPVEGGPNKAIKDFLRNHRGLTINHARRGIDWLLYKTTHNPKDPWDFVTETHWNPPKPHTNTKPDEPIGPAEYDTGFTYEDGIKLRQGWAGRHP